MLDLRVFGHLSLHLLLEKDAPNLLGGKAFSLFNFILVLVLVLGFFSDLILSDFTLSLLSDGILLIFNRIVEGQ